MSKHLNIVILTSPNPLVASGIIAYDFHTAFLKQGINSIIMTNSFAHYSDTNIICLTSRFSFEIAKIKTKILWHLRNWGFISKTPKIKTNPAYYMFGLEQQKWKSKSRQIIKKLPFKPDAFIYIFDHWFLNARDLSAIQAKTKAKILWYMADMAPMSGGCHYSRDCNGYKNNCGNCPGLYSTVKNDLSNQNWEFKNRYIQPMNLSVIAGSEWQYQQLIESSIFKYKKKNKIILPIDENLFTIGNKNDSRNLLDIPLDKKVLFFGAFSVNEERKGFAFLMEAITHVKEQLSQEEFNNILIIIAGRTLPEDVTKSLLFTYKFLGLLSHEKLATAFQAADMFICPSIEDSGPMMINQSILCGTPVVAFEMGVALDLVITGKTGYKAILKDSNDLADGILHMLKLETKTYQEYRKNCRALGLQLCQSRDQIKKIIELVTT